MISKPPAQKEFRSLAAYRQAYYPNTPIYESKPGDSFEFGQVGNSRTHTAAAE